MLDNLVSTGKRPYYTRCGHRSSFIDARYNTFVLPQPEEFSSQLRRSIHQRVTLSDATGETVNSKGIVSNSAVPSFSALEV